MKVCSKCSNSKELNLFNRMSSSKDGYRPECKECRKSETKRYRDKNKDKISAYLKEYSNKNKAHLKEYYEKWYSLNRSNVIEYQKKYRDENSKYIRFKKRSYVKMKRDTDPLYKLRMNIRSRIKISIKKNRYNHSGTSKILGAEIDYVKNHLEKLFSPGMTWDNYGQWHIDHIIPLSSAKNKIELLSLCHYTNLQPLWAKDNLSKGCKVI